MYRAHIPAAGSICFTSLAAANVLPQGRINSLPIQPAYVEAETGLDMNSLVARVFAALPLDVPFVTPKHVAPIMGMTENQFTYHCRACKKANAFRGSWRFMLDDADHMAALAAVVRLALWSARKLDDKFRLPTNNSTHQHVH